MTTNSRGTVLAIEREPQVRRVLGDILGRAGFEVLLARDGRGALEISEERGGRIDLLLVDERHREIAELIRRQPELKILGLSGSAGAEFPSSLAVLHKPFTPAALLEAVDAVLGGPGRRSQAAH
jgi:DNA-binding response OmpR family regulator